MMDRFTISLLKLLSILWILRMPAGLTLSIGESQYTFNYAGYLCRYNDQEYKDGNFQLTPCVDCHCDGTTGTLTCTHQDCPKLDNVTQDGCIKYGPTPGKCCPECLEHGCVYEGKSYPNGVQVPSAEPCKHCFCTWQASENSGQVLCFNITCPKLTCEQGGIPKGECCPVCKQAGKAKTDTGKAKTDTGKAKTQVEKAKTQAGKTMTQADLQKRPRLENWNHLFPYSHQFRGLIFGK